MYAHILSCAEKFWNSPIDTLDYLNSTLPLSLSRVNIVLPIVCVRLR